MSNPNNYTVGWICAVLKEYTAAQLFLDHEHESPVGISASDTNHYTLGDIAGHKVVIAVLPDGEYGVGSAASVVTNLLNSFPNVRFGLMVGIGGGAPTSKNDIRLGDVVVSSPINGTGGVYQYDLGKTIQDVGFVQTGILDQPSATVRSALPGLRRRYDIEGHQIKETIDSILERWPRLRKKGFARPSPESDRLFASKVVHPLNGEGDCVDVCLGQQSSIIIRQLREDDDDDPAIHYGPIASGNQLMKDAVVRDRLAKEKGILCFEMEAAGLMNRFPCMVIRGICDYSDSHKNKEWQGYAALTAAAYAKDLLREILPHRLETEEKLATHLSQLSEEVRGIDTSLKDIKNSDQTKMIIEWLRAPDPSVNHNRAHEKHGAGTSEWLYTDPQFLRWRSSPDAFIWLFGPSGCGKTVLSSTVIERLHEHDSRPVIFFYFDFNDQNKQTFESMVRSFLVQLYHKSPDARSLIQSLHAARADGSQQSSIKQMEKTLTEILEKVGGCKVVIDALEESKTVERVIRWCKDMHECKTVNVCLFVTSQTQIVNWHDTEQIMPITNANVSSDIRTHVCARLENEEFSNLRGHPELHDQIRELLVEKAAGMFRWADLQLDALSKCHNKFAIEKALDDLPVSLNDTYARILSAVKAGPHCGEVTSILKMLLWSSDVTTSIEGYNDAIVVRPDMTPAFDVGDRLFDLSAVVSICSGLVALVRIDDTEALSLCFAHASVKDFLMSAEVPQPFKRQLEERDARVWILRTCFAYLRCLDWRFDDKLDFMRKYPFAISANEIWPQQARALEDTDDEVLKLTIDFLQSDLLKLPAFFDFSYPLAHFGEQECSSLFYAAPEGLVRSCRYLIQCELKAAELQSHQDSLTVGSGLDSEDPDGMVENVAVRMARTFLMAVFSRSVPASIAVDSATAESQPSSPAKRLQLRLDTALITASFKGHDDIVRDLLHHGASASAIDELNFHTPPGISALLAAAEYGHLEIVKMLIKQGASLNRFVPEKFGTPLYAASKLGHLAVVEFLIEQHADPNIICGTCGSALLAAVQGDHTEIVNALIACGADVNVVPWDPDAQAFMKSKGIEDSAAWFNNPTLTFFSQFGTGLNMVQQISLFSEMATMDSLVEQGGDCESHVKAAIMRFAALCGHGLSPLQSASSSGRLDIVKALVEAGADINAPGYHGTAFALAVQNGHENLIDFLLGRADVNLKRSVFLDGLDWSPLEVAAATKQVATVRKILSHGGIATDSILALAAGVPNNAGVVELLINAKANPDGRDMFGRTALQNAAVTGQDTTVEMLLRYGAWVDAAGPDDSHLGEYPKEGAFKHAILLRGIEIDVQADGLKYGTALQAAVYRSHRAVVQILLGYGASISHPGPGGDALAIAASLGNLEMVDLLLESKQLANRTSDGSTALRIAAEKNHVDVVRRLLACGIPPNIAGPDGTALVEAARNGHEDVILALLAGGADIDSDEGYGLTPLHTAVKFKQTAAVRILLDHNADVNKVGDKGSALGHAVELGEEEIVNMLLSKGALVDGNEGPKHLIPLQAAVFKGYERLVKVLIDAGADVNGLDEAGLSPTPLRYACQVNREDIARLLLERGADVNAGDQHYALTPIQFCCAMGYESLVHTLVSFGADIDAPHADGCALDRAVDKGHLSIVTYLLNHGANPNTDTARGIPLHTSAFRGDIAIATLLLDHGADIDHSCQPPACEGGSRGALYQAVAEGQLEVVRLLLSRGASVEVAIEDAKRSGNEEIMNWLMR